MFVEERIIQKKLNRLKTLKLKMSPFAKSLQKKKKEFPVPKIISSKGMQILSKRKINTFDNFDSKYYTKFYNKLGTL